MTGHFYRDVILEQHVRLFRGAMGAEFLFMDDNARPHRANIVDECLQSEDITRMDWRAYSPDLNPIEHVESSSFIHHLCTRRVPDWQPTAIRKERDMNILKTILHPEHVNIVSVSSGPSKPVLRMSFLDESIRNVGERDSSKPFSPTSSEHSSQLLLPLERTFSDEGKVLFF
ncbi:transposable element Tcb2 transposase [Trichonephila clavipes]|nr:transposable element Tcb2 transposase [Trichonephila clavipes]